MTTKPISVAIIGAGNMAEAHIPAFADIDGVSVTGIFSRTRSRAQALADRFNIPHVCNSVAELHQVTQADLVVVTVFEMAMSHVAIECCGFPWAIFLEKPPGRDLADAQLIQAAAQSAGRNVMVGLNRRFLSSTRSALADLDDAAPRFVNVLDQQNMTEAAAYGHPTEVIHNWMYANSIHLVDYLRSFCRGAVTGVERIIPWQGPATARVLALVRFASGDAGTYQCTWQGPGPWAVAVTTAQRRWEMRPLEAASVQSAGERRITAIDMHDWDRQFKPGFRLQAEHAIRRVAAQPSEVPALDEAMQTMDLISRIYEA